MSDRGNRLAQKVVGGVILAVSAGLLLLHYTTDHTPTTTELYIGAGGLVIGAWLVAPVGMGRIGDRLGEMYRRFRGEDQ